MIEDWRERAVRLRERAPRLALWAVRNPRRALQCGLLVTLLPLPALFFLRIDTDGRTLVPRGDPAVVSDAAIRERFQLLDLLIVHIRSAHREGIFNQETLGRIQAVTDLLHSFSDIGPGSVTSLATEKRDRLLPGSSSSFVSFLEPLPASREELDRLKRDLAAPAARVHLGVLVSEDGRSAAVLAGVPSLDRDAEIDRRALYRRIAARVLPLAAGGDRVSIVGAPAAEALLGDHVLRDLAWLIPLCVALMAVVLWCGTRRAACLAIFLGKAGLCIVWTFAILALFGIPVYLTITVLPVVLATMAMSDEVHLLMRFQRLLAEEADRHAAVERTVRELTTSVVLATATTCVGFLSFASSPIAPVRALGLGAAIGISWSLLFSLTVTPALLASLPASWFDRARSGRAMTIQPRTLLAVVRRPGWTLAAIGAGTLLAGAGVARLTIHDSWIESFAEKSAFRLETGDVNRVLNGTHLLHLSIPCRSREGSPTPCADPDVLERLARLESFLRSQPQVGGVIGLHSQLTALSSFWNPGLDPAIVLRDPREVRRLLNRYELSPGLQRRRQVVDDRFGETVVTMFLRDANYRETRKLIARAEDWIGNLAPAGDGDLGWAGDVAVSQATIPAIVRTQLLSLPLALLGVFLVVAVLYQSSTMACAALLPVTLSAVWLLGALGWLGLPLGIATSMFFAISLGLGVDSHSIHFVAGYQRLRATDPDDAVSRNISEVGPAIAVNSAAVAAGFGLLVFSSVPANARLGLLIASALVVGGLLTLFGLGSLQELGRRARAGSTL